MEEEGEEMGNRLRGAFAVLVTPFNKDYSLNETGLRENIEWLIAEGIGGIIPAGSTGEFVSLSENERKRLIEVTVDQVGGRVPVCAGAGAETTSDAVMYTQFAKEIGCDAVLILPPYYFGPNPEELYSHYKAISDSADIPIMIYNNPWTSGVDITVDVVLKLAEIENVKYIKESSGDVRRIGQLVLRANGKITPFAGFDDLLFESFIMGAEGGVIVAGNICPKLCSDLFHVVADQKDYDRARELYLHMLPLLSYIEGPVGKIVQIVKRGVDLVGHAGGPSRPPRAPLTENEEEKLKHILQNMKLI